jgi:hypothetical protein
MKDQLIALFSSLKANKIPFTEVITFIETYYRHLPTAFKNGDVYNEATQNQGSAKVLAFAKLNNLSAEDTLDLFAEHYQSVLTHLDGVDHQNIRQFIKNGWEGVAFEGDALVLK